MRILICDDDALFYEQVEKALIKYEIEHNDTFEIVKVDSGIRAIQEMKKKPFDVLFLDIELQENEIDGVQIGNILRNEFVDYQSQIVYISSKPEYAMSLFQNQPFDFLVKPIVYSQIEKVMNRLIQFLGRRQDFFSYQKKGQICRVRIDEILYFESYLKKTKIVTTEKEDEFYSSLKDVYDKLKDKQFFYCHKSILVNYYHIEEFYFDRLVLDNGKNLEISQAKRKEVRQLAMEWGS